MNFLKKYITIILSCLYLISISTYFWSQSRYPQLQGKLGSGIGTPIPDTLSFDQVLPHIDDAGMVHDIYISFVNWTYTNWKGMIFGILFGVGLLTLLHFTNLKKIPKNRFMLAIIGILNGLGLGVCANCSTPIGKSIISGGIHPIVGINTIISSPSFNVIGIGLLFSLFPWYIALGKIIFYIIVVLILVPLIFYKDVSQEKYNKSKVSQDTYYYLQENIFYGIKKFCIVFFRNFIFLITKTLPYMVIGGMIGVTILAILPIEILSSLEVTPVYIIFTAIISFLLPVPMLFDIIFSALVYDSSIPSIFAIILLLNLGGFSIYPFLVLKKDVSFRHLIIFCGAFIIISVIFTFSLITLKELDENTPTSKIPSNEFKRGYYSYLTSERNYDDLNYIKKLTKKQIDNIFNPEKISINYIKTNHYKDAKKTGGYTTIYDKDIGIHDNGFRLSLMFSGIGINDYNNDGFDDIVLGSANGVKIYKNIGGFFQQDKHIYLGETLESIEVSQANFYDLDGDRYKDLLIATRTQGIFILWNNNGEISITDSSHYDITKDESHTYSMSLGDAFNNGNVDIFIGEGSFLSQENLGNFLLENLGNRKFKVHTMQTKYTGSTLSSLIWDFNNDGKNEIYEGNDFGGDIIYNIKEEKIQILENPENILSNTSDSNMGISMGDINNDLQPEYFISGKDEEASSDNKNIPSNCTFLQDSILKKECEIKEIVIINAIRKDCQSIKNIHLQALCNELTQIVSVHSLDNEQKIESICNSVKDSFHFHALYNYCKNKKNVLLSQKPYFHIPEKNENVFLQSDQYGKNFLTFPHSSIKRGWSWSSFFEDLDNNGYQDLYIANGYIRNREFPISNKLFLNDGISLKESSKEKNIENYLDTLTSGAIDIDNDGNLDIVSGTVLGDIIIHKNLNNKNNYIKFTLNDSLTQNTEGIGAKVIITTEEGKKQIRYNYIGGNFMTLQNTSLHFGLGKSQKVIKVQVIWPDGKIQILDQEFQNSKNHIIQR